MTNYMMIQSQGLSSSFLRIKEETMLMMQKKNQGIVTILGNSEGCWDTYTTASASSPLRRTLSADMSSKKWLSHDNDISSSPMKKIASSEELTPKTIANSFSSSSSSSPSFSEEEDYEERKDEFDDAEAERERLEIWSSIQRNKKEEIEKSSSGSGPFDTWSSIMSLKGNEISKSLPLTPYVHPLVKRSKSSLSEKSLEICTESLGSETGSDGCLFSSYPPSESEDNNKDTEQQQQQEGAYEAEEEEYWYKNHAMTHKKSPSPRSFPPPLPSLSLQANKKGPSLHLRPHRDNGRLVLEAVSLPSQNNFNAQRQDGRLVLTFSNAAAADDDDEVVEENYDDDEGVEEFEEEFGGFEEDEDDYYCEGEYDDDDEEEEEEEQEEEEGVIEESEVVEVGDVESVMMEKAAPLLSSGVTSSVHRLALMMNNHKPIGLVNKNPNWSEKFNKGVNLEDVSVVEMEPSSMAQSLPQRVARLIPSAAAASFNFNAYEYYWKTKPTSESDDKVHSPLAYHQQNNNYSPYKNNYGSKVIFSGDMNQVVSNEQQQLLVLRGKNGDYLVHNLKSCKDSRRPFLFWEPYCIATS